MSVRLLVEALEEIANGYEERGYPGRCARCSFTHGCDHVVARDALAAFRASPALADDPALVSALSSAICEARNLYRNEWSDDLDDWLAIAAAEAVDLYQRGGGR